MQYNRYGGEDSRLYLAQGTAGSGYYSLWSGAGARLSEAQALADGGAFAFWRDGAAPDDVAQFLAAQSVPRALLWIDCARGLCTGSYINGVYENGYRLRLPALGAFTASDGALHCAAEEVRFYSPRACLEAAGELCVELTGERAGSLCVPLELPASSGREAFERLGCGLRFSLREKLPRCGVWRRGVCAAQTLWPAGLPRLELRLWPLAWYDPAWTRLSVESPDTYETAWESIYGEPLTLRAQAGALGLCFARPPVLAGSASLYNAYLTFEGELSVSETAAGGTFRLLCGNGGAEYVSLLPGQTMRFQAGQPACFGTGEERAVQWDTGGTTAWAAFGPGEGEKCAPLYCAQPERGPFFSIGEQDFLPYQELPSCNLEGTRAFRCSPVKSTAATRMWPWCCS